MTTATDTPKAGEAQALHDAIMNLPTGPDSLAAHFAYKRGHRDARHAAAEMVLPRIVKLTAERDKAAAERDAARNAMHACLGFVQVNDRDKPFNHIDLHGEMVTIRLTGLVALVRVLHPGVREKLYQDFFASAKAALSAPTVGG